MRLTSNKSEYGYDFNLSHNSNISCEDLTKIITKLGQLEDILENHNIETLEQLDGLLLYVKQIKDIESELGIELIIFFKALRDGIHIIDDDYPYDDGVDLIYSLGIPCGFKCRVSDYCVFFKDYGKTWALTKEELDRG